MPESIEIRVLPRNQRWEVSANGVTRRLIDWLCTKERAVAHAIKLAHELRVRHAIVVVERSDGSIEQRLIAA